MTLVESSVLRRLGFFAYRRRWAIVGAWLLVFVCSAALAPQITTILKGGGYSTPSSQANRAFSVVERIYGSRTLVFTAVFQSSSGTSDARAAAARFDAKVRGRLGATLSPSRATVSADRAIVFVRVFSQPRADYGIPLTGQVRSLLPHQRGLVAYITGASAVFFDMERASDADLQRMEIITFPIALVILLIIFGTLAGAFVPVAMGPLTVSAALAFIFVIGHFVDMSIFVLNTVSMLGLGVAIDYSLFMVQRFREQLRRGDHVSDAVSTTVATAGRAIFVSALTVAIGFLGMVVFNVSMLTSLGVGGAVVVVLSLLAALTLLPALLGILGTRVNSLSILPAKLSSTEFWERLAAFVMHRPWRIVGLVLLVTVILALPARTLRVGVPSIEILPTSSQSRMGDTLLQHHIGAADGSPVLIALRSKAALNQPGVARQLERIGHSICSRQVVAGVAASPVVNAARDVLPCAEALAKARLAAESGIGPVHSAVLTVFLRVDPSSAQAESFVNFVRRLPISPGVELFVGGQTAAQIDFDNYLYGRFPFAILLVAGSVLVILAIAFRSVLLPLKAVLMNCLSVAVAYGAVVFVFQDGNLRNVFGFTPTGALDSIVPIFLFCVLFGLSTDYEVFLLMRAREEYIRSGDNTHSVSTALQRTGKMITSAALIMVAIFGVFSFASLVIIKELGLALAVGVAFDATFIRALLVPAAMRILGKWNWWPGIRGGMATPAYNKRIAAPLSSSEV